MCIPQTKWGWIGVFVLAALIIAAPPLWWQFRHRMERDPAAPPELLSNSSIRGSGPATHTHTHVTCKENTHSHLNRSRRTTPVQSAKTNDWCLKKYGGIELNYTMGSQVTLYVWCGNIQDHIGGQHCLMLKIRGKSARLILLEVNSKLTLRPQNHCF